MEYKQAVKGSNTAIHTFIGMKKKNNLPIILPFTPAGSRSRFHINEFIMFKHWLKKVNIP